MLTSLVRDLRSVGRTNRRSREVIWMGIGNRTPRAHQPVGWCFRSVLPWLWSGNSARSV